MLPKGRHPTTLSEIESYITPTEQMHIDAYIICLKQSDSEELINMLGLTKYREKAIEQLQQIANS